MNNVVTTHQVAVALHNICQRANRPEYPISVIQAVRTAINTGKDHNLVHQVKAEIGIKPDLAPLARNGRLDPRPLVIKFVRKNPWTGLSEIARLLGSSNSYAGMLIKELVERGELQTVRLGRLHVALPGANKALIDQQREVAKNATHGTAWAYRMGCRCVECFKKQKAGRAGGKNILVAVCELTDRMKGDQDAI